MSYESIPEMERAIERVLLSGRGAQFPPELLQQLNLLISIGYQPIVKLTDAQDNRKVGTLADVASDPGGAVTSVSDMDSVATGKLKDLLRALDQAETVPGRGFVALKWFRDEWLPSSVSGWTQSQDLRQEALTQAIGDGWVLTSRVPNPKAPLHPTTTVKLNRSKQFHASPKPQSRFRPAVVAGEPLSATILKDRGGR